MSIAYVIMCDEPLCNETAEAWSTLTNYRPDLARRGWWQNAVTGADYCPKHNPIKKAAREAHEAALQAALADEVSGV